MKILIIGKQEHLNETQLKFGQHAYTLNSTLREASESMGDCDVIFDFIIDEDPGLITLYTGCKSIVFLNTTKITLAELLNRQPLHTTFFGFTGLPGFLNRDILEVALLKKEDEPVLKQTCEALQTSFLVVDDRVGLVTPRVIAMIINEAYYTVQEGTATKEDIDLAMKAGTNYPYGPFEWCSKIGIGHVYELLKALYHDTYDERYKICPLLKKEYLKR